MISSNLGVTLGIIVKCQMLFYDHSYAHTNLHGSSKLRRKWGEVIYETPFRQESNPRPRGLRRTTLLVRPLSCPVGIIKHMFVHVCSVWLLFVSDYPTLTCIHLGGVSLFSSHMMAVVIPTGHQCLWKYLYCKKLQTYVRN
jgi:hypothetical protein